MNTILLQLIASEGGTLLVRQFVSAITPMVKKNPELFIAGSVFLYAMYYVYKNSQQQSVPIYR